MARRAGGPSATLAMLLALALVVGACQSQPSGPTPQTGSDQPDPGGELVTNMGGEPDTIDPHKASFLGEIAVIMTVFEGLMSLDPRTLATVPAAAAKDPDVSADGKVWKFTLRDDLKFSDGTPLKAQDYVRGFARTCDPATLGEYAFVLYVIEGCEKWNKMQPRKVTPAELDAAKKALGIRALSATEIEFRLREPAAYFGSITYMWVGMPVKQESLDKGGEKWTEPATYIGNGPFKLVEWKHNEKMVFERNEHFRMPVKLKRWTRMMINEGAVAYAAYRSNELDLAGVAAEDLRTVESDPELKAQVSDLPGSCTFYFSFNTRKPPFDDIKVRQAFARSFDREAYIRDVQRIGTPASGGFIPPGFPGHDPQDDGQKFDPILAKKLLSESRYAGRPELQNIKLTYPTGGRTKIRIEWVQQQWKANLGIEVVLDPVDGTAYSQLVKRAETLPLLFQLGWCADFPDQQNWLTTVFHSDSESLSRTGWKNEEFDKLTRQADQESSKEKRDQTYLLASRIATREAPAAWLFYNASKFLMKPWVKGVTHTAIDAALGQFRLWEIYVTKKR